MNASTLPNGLTLEVYANGQRWVTCPSCAATDRANKADKVKHTSCCTLRAAVAIAPAFQSATEAAKAHGLGSEEHRYALRTEASIRGVSYAMNRDTD
jgi:hypothetical protein